MVTLGRGLTIFKRWSDMPSFALRLRQIAPFSKRGKTHTEIWRYLAQRQRA